MRPRARAPPVPLHAIRARSLSEQVFEQLAAEIITGRYSPGDNLPAERALTDVFDVNRHVVREALKRLEQIGLVKVSQGGGTKVLDFKRHAGLDLLAIMSEHARGGEDVGSIWMAVLEMRAVIAADLARLCAERATPEVKADLVSLAQQMKDAAAAKQDERTNAEIFRFDVLFWERVADGAGNIAYRLALNTMIRSSQANGKLAMHWVAEQLKLDDFRRAVAAAIASGDAHKAEALTREAMRAEAERFAVAIGKGREQAPEAKPRRQRA
jgi:GntR family transcriptional repressor for pyruvate dehydrogenase complex